MSNSKSGKKRQRESDSDHSDDSAQSPPAKRLSARDELQLRILSNIPELKNYKPGKNGRRGAVMVGRIEDVAYIDALADAMSSVYEFPESIHETATEIQAPIQATGAASAKKPRRRKKAAKKNIFRTSDDDASSAARSSDADSNSDSSDSGSKSSAGDSSGESDSSTHSDSSDSESSSSEESVRSVHSGRSSAEANV